MSKALLSEKDAHKCIKAHTRNNSNTWSLLDQKYPCDAISHGFTHSKTLRMARMKSTHHLFSTTHWPSEAVPHTGCMLAHVQRIVSHVEVVQMGCVLAHVLRIKGVHLQNRCHWRNERTKAMGCWAWDAEAVSMSMIDVLILAMALSPRRYRYRSMQVVVQKSWVH